jgi:hypothetical protein
MAKKEKDDANGKRLYKACPCIGNVARRYATLQQK